MGVIYQYIRRRTRQRKMKTWCLLIAILIIHYGKSRKAYLVETNEESLNESPPLGLDNDGVTANVSSAGDYQDDGQVLYNLPRNRPRRPRRPRRHCTRGSIGRQVCGGQVFLSSKLNKRVCINRCRRNPSCVYWVWHPLPTNKYYRSCALKSGGAWLCHADNNVEHGTCS